MFALSRRVLRAVSCTGVAALAVVTAAHRRATTVIAPGCVAGNAGLTLPTGFCAGTFAEGLGGPRHMAVAPNGDVFVMRQSRVAADSLQGGVVVLRDRDKDGRAEVMASFGPVGGTGIAIDGGYLFVDARTVILRYPMLAGALAPSGPPDTVVQGLPTGGHSAHNIAVDGSGTLFVNVGSRTNSCQERDRQTGVKGVDPCVELETRAGIWKFSSTALHQVFSPATRYATGIRNAVGMAWHPTNKALYATQHGRDQLFQNWAPLYDETTSAETPAEQFMRIDAGNDFGWPYCYYDNGLKRLVLAPEYGGDAKQAGRCTEKRTPLTTFPGHWAPNALAFYTGRAFPARFRGGAFIAFHGSWNRAPREQAGYKVVFVPSRAGSFTPTYETFADNFANGKLDPSSAEHRPTGLATTADGALLISDDKGGRVYRIQYAGTKR